MDETRRTDQEQPTRSATISQLQGGAAELDARIEDLTSYGREGDEEQIADLTATAHFLEAEITRRHRRAAFDKVRRATAKTRKEAAVLKADCERAAEKPTPAMLQMLENLPCEATEIPSVYGTSATWAAIERRGWGFYSHGRCEISNAGRAVRRDAVRKFRATTEADILKADDERTWRPR